MALKDTITSIMELLAKLQNNKVANFAYTENAYNNNIVDGVTAYNYSNEQNIPTANANILKVSSSILTKGFRSQASSMTRMLVNHFFGRTSYNLNKAVDNLYTFLDALNSAVGTANGLATLDADGCLAQKNATASIETDMLQDGCVTEDKIANGAVTVNKIAVGAVSTSKIQDGAVTGEKIQNLAIDTSKIVTQTIEGDKIADEAVRTSKLQDLSVKPVKLNLLTTEDSLPTVTGNLYFIQSSDTFGNFVALYAVTATNTSTLLKKTYI